MAPGAWQPLKKPKSWVQRAWRAAARTPHLTARRRIIELRPQAAYLHFTSNETIHGVQFQAEPVSLQGVPLVCDMSSDFLSRPVEVGKYGLIYAGAQKNAGPAGVTVVILRQDLLERVPAGLPVMLDYKVQVAGGSMHNTPPCFAIYMVGLVLKWLKGEGGVAEIARRNQQKAGLIYAAIDNSGGFYRGHALLADRSHDEYHLPPADGSARRAVRQRGAGAGHGGSQRAPLAGRVARFFI